MRSKPWDWTPRPGLPAVLQPELAGLAATEWASFRLRSARSERPSRLQRARAGWRTARRTRRAVLQRRRRVRRLPFRQTPWALPKQAKSAVAPERWVA